MEFDPLYVDVIVRRWQRHTGESAVHSVIGHPFEPLDGYGLDPIDALIFWPQAKTGLVLLYLVINAVPISAMTITSEPACAVED
jgi:hypothetical protein